MLRLILAAGLATAPLVVAGQSTIYKVQMPDGSVLYSDSVPSGGKVLEERESKNTPRVTTVPSTPRTTTVPSTPVRPGATSVVRPSAPSKGVTPTNNIASLERDLAAAKARLEAGREPLPGERLGLKGGGSRLTPEYEARIAGMEREVAAIEAKLKSAYGSR